MWLFYHFNFERNYDVLKLKSPCIFEKKRVFFVPFILSEGILFNICVLYHRIVVLNTLSEYSYFYI